MAEVILKTTLLRANPGVVRQFMIDLLPLHLARVRKGLLQSLVSMSAKPPTVLLFMLRQSFTIQRKALISSSKTLKPSVKQLQKVFAIIME